MTSEHKTMERVPSGIQGYDEMIKGGYFKGTVNIISGESGTGKTVFGSQFLYEGAKKGEKCLCIVTSEASESLKREMNSSFGWDLWELEKSGSIIFVDITDPGLRLQKTVDMAPMELIKSFKKLLSRKVEEVKPDRIFIDSIEALFLAIDSHYKLKTLVDDLFGELRTFDITTLVTVGTTFEVESIVEYGADSVTRLGRVVSGNNLQRSIYVAKFRGSGTINEIRVLNISDNGIKVLDQSPYTSTI
ncbi:MAG: ATPase domain-containing protein [Methanosarcinales archaeon]|nr:AAA family ATPase [ANME-2 cluster archaeon]MDF1530743.1 ATPase domain-containing protein [ANME-2 cluster archaeon]MDW7774714.1 ATPase domain-containing protein [Methanosarcinales archaeon]